MNLKAVDRFGIVDIGSNTIRGVLYRGGDKPCTLDNIVFSSNILADTYNGSLSDEGIDNLCRILLSIKDFFQDNSTEYIFAFATSAMRDVSNFNKVQQIIEGKTGILIDLISGDEEAECDFLAIKTVTSVPCGICVDLGGGSGQVISFNEEGVILKKSMPIGAKRVKNLFVKDIVPDDSQEKEIREYVEKELLWISEKNQEIWFMGGTAKKAKKLAKKIFGQDTLTLDFLLDIYQFVKENPNILKKIFPERYEAVAVGIFVMIVICQTLGGEKILVTKAGVRDGYVEKLYQHIL